MAEIDTEELLSALLGLMKWVRLRDDEVEVDDDLMAAEVRRRLDRVLRPPPKPKAPLKHDWREYRSNEPSFGICRGFLCARCGKKMSWSEGAFPRDFRETDSHDKRPCAPENIQWIDESPLTQKSY